MALKIRNVFSHRFERYGKVLGGYDTKELLDTLNRVSDKPADGTIYTPGDAQLEALPIAKEFSTYAYGGMPVQLGYCNGNNTKLNCLEYHRGSELNIPADDIILLVAPLQSVKNGRISSELVEAFRAPAGTVVELYETTLHYAPCNDVRDGELTNGFRVVIVLPKDTNTARPQTGTEHNLEDRLLWARNKWLIAHPDSAEAKQGAFVGISGQNINIKAK